MAKMMDETLAASLEALENGDSIESILSRYPALATELRPFLETAVFLNNQATNPTIAAKSASLAAMKKEAAALRPQKPGFLAQFFHRARRFAPAMAVVALLFLLFMTMNAPPSSPLYGARQVLDGWRNEQQENDGVVDVEVVKTAVSPTIAPMPTNTPTITATATLTPTLTTTPTETATVTATIAPSTTPLPPTLTATPLPAPMPTETAVSDDDDDESDEPDEPDEDDEPDDPEEDDEPEDPED